MNFAGLAQANRRFFRRYYKLTALAALITTAVIAGSLAVGDSVRTTLVKRVAERLGDTETILFSRHAFMAEEIMSSPFFGGSAAGILLTNGFISHDGRLIPVSVWGVDHMPVYGGGAAANRAFPQGAAAINRALLQEMGGNVPEAIVLRLPAPGLVPSGSLFVTGNYTTGMRLSFDRIAEVNEGGNISLKNEQTIPLNIFVNRSELAQAMQTPGRMNLILSARPLSAGELNRIWNPSISGLSVDRKDGFTEITSERIFLPEPAVETILRNNRGANRLFSYLANSIERQDSSIPYSFVTALDRYRDEPLQRDRIILSDYAAHRLQAKTGDTVRLAFFTSHDLKTLKTDTLSLCVEAIVPLQELSADRSLSADFPGLSDVERCTDWDSDLPIDMHLITAEDEKYWQLYRTTPKAIIAYEAIAAKWSNAYGSATAIRISGAEPDLSELRAEMFGIQLIHPGEAALYAAKNGVDFSGLFLALGFFIILSAMLLMLVPLSGMFHRRRGEIALLKALGYTRKRITRLIWKESAPVVLASSAAGVIAGLLYTALIMWLLGNVWQGATHTDGFSVYPGITTLVTGLLTGIALSLCLLRATVVKSLKKPRHNPAPAAATPGGVHHKKPQPLQGKKAAALSASVLAAVTVGVNFLYFQSVPLFVTTGIILIGTAALWGDYLVCRNGMPAPPSTPSASANFHSGKLVWSTLFAGRRQAMLSFFTLAAGVFIVFSVGLNRKGFNDSSQLKTGTGGYSLWCETSVPLYHNMATQSGREKLSLTALPADAAVLQCLRYNADDASCLNLNKVTTPTVLGVDMNALRSSGFRLTHNLSPPDGTAALQRKDGPVVYPALVDATVLTWGLMLNPGDTLWYEGDGGQTVGLRLSGILANSVFQGNILIDRALFSEIWKETTGSEVILLKVKETEKEAVKTLLSQALHEYGIRVTTTNDRLKQFNTVTDTYLTIFLTLGSLGLLLGLVSFIIVVRKSLSSRRREIGLYRTLGFTDRKIQQILYKENILLPLYAIITGLTGSLAGAAGGLMHTGTWVWLTACLFTLLFAGLLILFVRKSVKKEIRNT
jgi:putative ABC transport system permease protein